MRLPLIWFSSLAVAVGSDPGKTSLRPRGQKGGVHDRDGVIKFNSRGTSTGAQSLPEEPSGCFPESCVFPFSYYGVEYNSCTQIGSGGKGSYDFAWCSTAAIFVVGSGHFLKCGDCPATPAPAIMALSEAAPSLKEADARTSATRVVFQNHPSTIIFGSSGGSGGSGGGVSRIIFNDSPREIVFGGTSDGSDGEDMVDGHTLLRVADNPVRTEQSNKSRLSGNVTKNSTSNRKDLGVRSGINGSSTLASLEQKLIDQDKQLAERLDALERQTNASLQKAESNIREAFGKVKDVIPPKGLEPAAGTSSSLMRKRNTEDIDKRVTALEEYISQQAHVMSAYKDEIEELKSSKRERDALIDKLETKLKAVQGDVESIDVSKLSAKQKVVVHQEDASESSKQKSGSEAKLAEAKAELNIQMEAIRNTIATFEVDTRAKMQALEKEVNGQHFALESRVRRNEGRLRGVKERSMGKVLR